MTEHFVTLFDKNFLPLGLNLYDSLEKNLSDFKLWVLCVDKETELNLKKINKPSLQTISIEEYETDVLKSVKKKRSIGEYCWTLTPLAPKKVFDIDKSIKRVTYLDADMFFFNNIDLILQEFDKSGKSILITEHDFDLDHAYKEKISGKYDVIISIGTLEHMDKPYTMLKKFKTHLRPRGKIILTSPNWTNPRGFILMTLGTLFDAPITLADLHYLTPVDFIKWADRLELKLDWKTIEHSWGNGDKLIADLKQRLPKIFKDMKINVKQQKIDLFLKWINQRVLPIIQSSEENGAIGIYVLSKRK